MPKPRGAGKSVVKSLSIDLKSAPLWTDTSLGYHRPMTIIDALYLEKIAQIRSASRRLAYRGQSNSAWGIRSGAARRLLHHVTESHSKDYEGTVPFGKLYVMYHQHALLEPARTYGFDLSESQSDSDLQLLSQLQHFGAATGLIDFTWDSLVALWFATSAPHNRQCAGRIFVIDLNDTTHFTKVGLRGLVWVNPELDQV